MGVICGAISWLHMHSLKKYGILEMQMHKLKHPSKPGLVFQWYKPSLVCGIFVEAQWRRDVLRTKVFQCSFHAGCWKYTRSHRGPCCPIHCPNHERVHLKPQRLDMTWVYCLGYISLPSVPSRGIHRLCWPDEDCRICRRDPLNICMNTHVVPKTPSII